MLAVMPFDDEAEAIRLANGTEFGLVAGVWTRDGARQMRLARKLRCGQVFINNYGAGGGVELPFGGVKASGYGREEVKRNTEIFRGQIIDVTPSIYTVQLAGTSDKLDAFLATLREVAKIVEVARSGVVGLSRGDKIMR